MNCVKCNSGVMECAGEVNVESSFNGDQSIIKFVTKGQNSSKIQMLVCSRDICGYVEFVAGDGLLHKVKQDKKVFMSENRNSNNILL